MKDRESMDHEEIAGVLQSISFAVRKHQGQLRKDGVTPYAAHPMRVLTILAIVFRVRDPIVLAAAALHDTIEDTTTDWDDLAELFGNRVADIVATLTKNMSLPEQQRETEYFAGLATSPVEAKLCKLADAYDNLLDSSSLPNAGRLKAIAKAEHLIRVFEPEFPEAWRHVLDALRQLIADCHP